MSAFLPQKTVSWLLVLALGHVPLPWAHSHQFLGKEQLKSHLARYHAQDDANVPLGWHFHLVCLGVDQQLTDELSASGSSVSAVYYQEQPRVDDQDGVAFYRCTRGNKMRHPSGSQFVLYDLGPSNRADLGAPAFASLSHVANGVPLYELYCSLLI